MKLHATAYALGSILSLALSAGAQDSPSLGDVARQAREKRQQNAVLQAKDGQTSNSAKVITNEEIPEVSDAELARESSEKNSRSARFPRETAGSVPPEVWKSKILAQKNAIASQEAQIQRLNDSIHFASGACVRGCVQWNELQVQKQDEVEQMRSNLEEQKKYLQDMEEAARQQGYGGSVYDP